MNSITSSIDHCRYRFICIYVHTSILVIGFEKNFLFFVSNYGLNLQPIISTLTVAIRQPRPKAVVEIGSSHRGRRDGAAASR